MVEEQEVELAGGAEKCVDLDEIFLWVISIEIMRPR